MQNQDQCMDEGDIENSLMRVLDILELPTRKSIQVDICDITGPKVTQMVKFGFESAPYVVLLNLWIYLYHIFEDDTMGGARMISTDVYEDEFSIQTTTLTSNVDTR